MPKPQRRTQEERRTETRTKLIDATLRLLAENGAARLTTQAVAEAAGLTRGSVQYHFASPTDLLKAALMELPVRLGTRIDVDVLRDLPLDERVDRMIDQYWTGFGSNIYAAFLELAMRGRLDPELKSVLDEALAQFDRDRAASWLDLFHDSGRSEKELAVWRATLLTTMRGLALTRMLAEPGTDITPQIRQFKTMFKAFLEES